MTAGEPAERAASDGGPEELEADDVVYELDDWDEVQRATLEEVLAGEGVGYRWHSTQLVVGEPDADLVEEIIDGLDHPDALEVEEDDGDDGGAEILSSLYVAADVLSGAPRSGQAAEELLAAVQATAAREVPYGIDPTTWSELGRLADDVASCLRQGADDEVVVAAARRLRQAVHPLV